MGSEPDELAYLGFMLAARIAIEFHPKTQEQWLHILREVAAGKVVATEDSETLKEQRRVMVETANLVLRRLSPTWARDLFGSSQP